MLYMLSANYNTKLSPLQELAFMLAAQKAHRLGDLTNYDLRGAWLADPKSISSLGHLTDEFKKPNHPTFSADSKYSSVANPGGNWVAGKNKSWTFVPSKKMISSAGGLAPFNRNFNASEQGQNSGVVIPPSY